MATPGFPVAAKPRAVAPNTVVVTEVINCGFWTIAFRPQGSPSFLRCLRHFQMALAVMVTPNVTPSAAPANLLSPPVAAVKVASDAAIVPSVVMAPETKKADNPYFPKLLSSLIRRSRKFILPSTTRSAARLSSFFNGSNKRAGIELSWPSFLLKRCA